MSVGITGVESVLGVGHINSSIPLVQRAPSLALWHKRLDLSYRATTARIFKPYRVQSRTIRSSDSCVLQHTRQEVLGKSLRLDAHRACEVGDLSPFFSAITSAC